MTILYNEKCCSEAFIRALHAAHAGKSIRLPHWPEGQYIAPHPLVQACLSVYRDNAFSSAWWMASAEEMDSEIWEILGGNDA